MIEIIQPVCAIESTDRTHKVAPYCRTRIDRRDLCTLDSDTGSGERPETTEPDPFRGDSDATTANDWDNRNDVAVPVVQVDLLQARFEEFGWQRGILVQKEQPRDAVRLGNLQRPIVCSGKSAIGWVMFIRK